MREKTVEQALIKAVQARNGICPKWVSPGLDGVPDRIVLLPHGKIGFVEMKAPGKKPRMIQEVRLQRLRLLGYKAFSCDRVELIDGILNEIES